MPLPTHRLEIRKSWGNRSWSNDWLLYVADMAEGELVANALVNFERQMHANVVSFDFYVLSTAPKDGRVFRHKAINLLGVNNAGTEQFLPMYCTMRVDLPTVDGDPARKYFRLPLLETQQSNGRLNSTDIATYQGIVNTHLVNSIALDNIVTPKGRVVGGATVHFEVQMRQLRRRRRKKAA